VTWQANRLKFLAAEPIRNGLGEAGAQDDSSWPRYIRTTDIAGPRTLREDVFASLPPEVAQRAMLRRGDIVMTAAGATIGKTLLYDSDKPACYAGYLASSAQELMSTADSSPTGWNRRTTGSDCCGQGCFDHRELQREQVSKPEASSTALVGSARHRRLPRRRDSPHRRADREEAANGKAYGARFWIAFTDSVLRAEARMTAAPQSHLLHSRMVRSVAPLPVLITPMMVQPWCVSATSALRSIGWDQAFIPLEPLPILPPTSGTSGRSAHRRTRRQRQPCRSGVCCSRSWTRNGQGQMFLCSDVAGNRRA